MTAPEKGRWYWAKNWLHYHWVYLVIAAVVLLSLIHISEPTRPY